jgi:hypothetical protein
MTTSSVYNFEYTAATVFITPTEDALNYSTKPLDVNFTYALPENLPQGGGARNVVSEPAESLMHTVEDFTTLISTSGGRIYEAITTYFASEPVKRQVLVAYNNKSIPQYTLINYDFTTMFSAFIAQVKYKIETSPVTVAPGDVFMFTFTFALDDTFAYKYAYYFKINPSTGVIAG